MAVIYKHQLNSIAIVALHCMQYGRSSLSVIRNLRRF